MRTYTDPTWRSVPAAPQRVGWSYAGLLPLGFAATWVVTDQRPDTSMVGLAAVLVAVAVLYEVVPSLVELGAGPAAWWRACSR